MFILPFLFFVGLVGIFIYFAIKGEITKTFIKIFYFYSMSFIFLFLSVWFLYQILFSSLLKIFGLECKYGFCFVYISENENLQKIVYGVVNFFIFFPLYLFHIKRGEGILKDKNI